MSSVRKNRWRPSQRFVLALSVLAVAGCATPAPPRVVGPRPVKTMIVTAGDEPHVRSFSGRVEASKHAELSFHVAGVLVNFPVRKGQAVKEGELIGQLRQDEFEARLKTLQSQLERARVQLTELRQGQRPEEQARRQAQVRATEARLANARAEFDRSARLIRTNAVSRTEYEQMETALRIARQDNEAARQFLEKGTVARVEELEAKEAEIRALEARVVESNIQLQDSTLRAPYDGIIAQRFVEQNQTIKAKQPIVTFQDVEEIEIAVDVPETVMAAEIRTADIVRLVASFSGAPGLEFPVYIKEVAQVADPTTQTFKVIVGMKSPQGITLLPGMTSVVTLTFRRASILDNRILVPVAAVYKESAGNQVAWVLVPEKTGPELTVTRRILKLGEPTGRRIEVLDGLQPGDRIAIAGVTFLREGAKVRDLGDELGGNQP